MQPPVCFLAPTENMFIDPRHTSVNPRTGLIALPSLAEWEPRGSTLLDLIGAMASVFSASPPLRQRAAGDTGTGGMPRHAMPMPMPAQQAPAAQPPPAALPPAMRQPMPPADAGDTRPEFVAAVSRELSHRLRERLAESCAAIDAAGEARERLAERKHVADEVLAALRARLAAARDSRAQTEAAIDSLRVWLVSRSDDVVVAGPAALEVPVLSAFGASSKLRGSIGGATRRRAQLLQPPPGGVDATSGALQASSQSRLPAPVITSEGDDAVEGDAVASALPSSSSVMSLSSDTAAASTAPATRVVAPAPSPPRVTVEDVVVPPSRLQRQLLDAVAEDAAIEDLCDVIDKLLLHSEYNSVVPTTRRVRGPARASCASPHPDNCVRPPRAVTLTLTSCPPLLIADSIDVDVALKEIRELARRQFRARSLAHRIDAALAAELGVSHATAGATGAAALRTSQRTLPTASKPQPTYPLTALSRP